jgi:hypothetical protein
VILNSNNFTRPISAQGHQSGVETSRRSRLETNKWLSLPDQRQEVVMTRNLIRRLEKLEAVASVQRFDSVGILHKDMAAPEMDRALKENERWVEDWYVDPSGRVCQVIQRITAVPSDCSRNYRRDAGGNESEDPELERRTTKNGPGGIVWVVPKPGAIPFATTIVTRILTYA